MTDIVYLNGEFIAKEHAKISVLDRGFLFADGVYEVIPVYRKTPFRSKQHLTRLFDSLKQIDLPSPFDQQQWLDLIDGVVARNVEHLGENQSIYLQVTRGSEPDRQHQVMAKPKPSVLIMSSALKDSAQTLTPQRATLMEDIRWLHCDIKSIALLANTLLINRAKAQGFDEAILHRDNELTEGASSNVFVVINGKIYTPPKSQFILGGITRDLIIELCLQHGLEVYQQRIHIEELPEADEIWICSSTREISPIVAIDDKIIGSGEIGPLTTRISSALQDFKSQLL